MYHSTLEVSTDNQEDGKRRRLVELTIAVYCTMSARLLPIALDFLASTFIASTRYTPPLLHGLWLWRLVVGDIIVR